VAAAENAKTGGNAIARNVTDVTTGFQFLVMDVEGCLICIISISTRRFEQMLDIAHLI
jgi:predicted enzyme related to lactoylglutathione lyase